MTRHDARLGKLAQPAAITRIRMVMHEKANASFKNVGNAWNNRIPMGKLNASCNAVKKHRSCPKSALHDNPAIGHAKNNAGLA